ncbi:hypothetical protein OH76DRAFT_85965 [Lentinus brumalis]|uniref:Uncharacterized protein n=1 Tax=Lentinus brumalis TaxID=2498619 RepID=A0A371CR22_9APHY|nr:hypothetical protein OH76DRAFT_85965 [Polyporus brumalis]
MAVLGDRLHAPTRNPAGIIPASRSICSSRFRSYHRQPRFRPFLLLSTSDHTTMAKSAYIGLPPIIALGVSYISTLGTTVRHAGLKMIRSQENLKLTQLQTLWAVCICDFDSLASS